MKVQLMSQSVKTKVMFYHRSVQTISEFVYSPLSVFISVSKDLFFSFSYIDLSCHTDLSLIGLGTKLE